MQPGQTYGAPPGSPPPGGSFDTTPPAPKKKKAGLIAGGIAAILVAGGIGAAVASGGGDEGDTTEASASSTTAVITDETTSSTVAEPVDVIPTVTELAQSTVQVLVLDANGEPTCVGSGTILTDDGMILTNAHVITPNGSGCQVEQIAIAVTTDAGLPPEPTYFADLLNFDFELDLAVLKIASRIDGGPLPTSFPTTDIGNSDDVTIGDNIRILGYPTIGGDTITFTNGSVSGFTSQSGVSDRSWIKTDATIAGGNSGGTAVNLEGELVGIPTQASAGEDSPIVDCRVITDTNGDGVTDGNDTCTPIGGFLNGIRPVNLALAILEDAKTATPLAPNAAGAAVPQTVSVNVEDVIAYHPAFSLGIGETIEETQFTSTAAAGTNNLCFWFDWQNLPSGAKWDAVWLVDGVVDEDLSLFDGTWAFELDGVDFWVCAQNEGGLVAGLYEIAFFVQDELVFIEALDVTAAPVPEHEVQFVNESAQEVCFLKVNPLGSSDVGLDELGSEDIIPIGGTYTLVLPEGIVIASALNCNGDIISQSSEGIQIVGNDVITISS